MEKIATVSPASASATRRSRVKSRPERPDHDHRTSLAGGLASARRCPQTRHRSGSSLIPETRTGGGPRSSRSANPVGKLGRGTIRATRCSSTRNPPPGERGKQTTPGTHPTRSSVAQRSTGPAEEQPHPRPHAESERSAPTRAAPTREREPTRRPKPSEPTSLSSRRR